MAYNKTYDYFLAALDNKLVNNFGGNVSALSRHLGFSRGYVSNIVGKIKPASYDAQVQIAQKFDFEYDEFLAFGKSLQNGETVAVINNNSKNDFIYIPKVAARLAAGSGSFETSSEHTGLYSFRSDWIATMGNPDNMVLMDVVGDSMYPIINDGDTIMLDQAKRDLLPNKVFAVRIEDLIYLKYIDREPGKIILRSHNKAYEPIVIETEFLTPNSFQILGRAIWWCHAELAQ